MAYVRSIRAGLIGVCCYRLILEIEDNQRGYFIRHEFAEMEKALTVKSGLSN